MVAKPLLADLRYVGTFSPPAFDLAARPTDVLRSFYDSLKLDFPISLADMQTHSGTSMADGKIRITMFGGNAMATISAGDVELAFQHIRTPDDFGVCTKVISLCRQALANSLPDNPIVGLSLACTVSLELEGGNANAAEHIARTVPLSPLAIGDFAGGTCRPTPSVEIDNSTAGWRATLQAVPNREILPVLIVGCTLEYAADRASENVLAELKHIHELVQVFCNAMDIEVVDPLFAGDK